MAVSRLLRRRRRCIILIIAIFSLWIAYIAFENEAIAGGSKIVENIQKNLDVKVANSISHKLFDNGAMTLREKASKNIIQNDTKVEDVTVFALSHAEKTENITSKPTNRSLEHKEVLEMLQPKKKIQYLFFPSQWSLNISFEDIGNIMKDTEFLNKLQPLDFGSPVLASTQNRTANYTYQMKYHVGFCDCWERNCVCCAKLRNRRLHLNKTLCSNFTFVSKTHELDLRVLLDEKLIHSKVISADEPPVLCLGSIPKVCDICVHFFNVTFKVNPDHDHKTQLLGCTDFSLNLYNKTIGAHPVDCFQIPGDPNKKHKDRHFNFVGNWMP